MFKIIIFTFYSTFVVVEGNKVHFIEIVDSSQVVPSCS